jgi:hypothetical protein
LWRQTTRLEFLLAGQRPNALVLLVIVFFHDINVVVINTAFDRCLLGHVKDRFSNNKHSRAGIFDMVHKLII